MRKFKSRKGMTLVEVVVTIAVLSIVSGMGVGIFAATMQHYSTASVTANEQEKAAALEEYLTSNARVAKKMDFVPDSSPSPSYAVPAAISGTYIAHMTGKNYFESYDYDASTNKKTSTMTFEGVEKVVLTFKRHQATAAASEEDFVFMDYEITMEKGYKINGSVIMNNLPLTEFDKLTTGTTNIVSSPPVVVGEDTTNSAVIFGK